MKYFEIEHNTGHEICFMVIRTEKTRLEAAETLRKNYKVLAIEEVKENNFNDFVNIFEDVPAVIRELTV